MVALNFTGARLARVAALHDQIVLADGVRRRNITRTASMTTGQYSSGAIKVIGTDGYAEQIVYTIASLDRRNYEKLRAWEGEPLLYRDDVGNLDVGGLRSVQADYGPDSVTGTYGPVTVTLLSTTHDERSFTIT